MAETKTEIEKKIRQVSDETFSEFANRLTRCLRRTGLYCMTYSNTDTKPKYKIEAPDVIAKKLKSDYYTDLGKTIASEPEVEYSLSDFTDSNETITLKEMGENDGYLFQTLAIRYLYIVARMHDSDIKKVITVYYNLIKK